MYVCIYIYKGRNFVWNEYIFWYFGFFKTFKDSIKSTYKEKCKKCKSNLRTKVMLQYFPIYTSYSKFICNR